MVQYLALTKIDWQLWCVQQTIGKRLSMLAVCPDVPDGVPGTGHSNHAKTKMDHLCNCCPFMINQFENSYSWVLE